jgi:hypothetical protein
LQSNKIIFSYYFFLGANPAIRYNLFFGEEKSPKKRISTAIGAKNPKKRIIFVKNYQKMKRHW